MSVHFQLEERIQRALSERIYIIGFSVDTDVGIIRFHVHGSQTKQYIVRLAIDNTITCTCWDFIQRGNKHPCKHILYIIMRVLRFTAIDLHLDRWEFNSGVVDAILYATASCLEVEIQEESSAAPAEVENLRADTLCVICFSDFEAGSSEELAKCHQCKHVLHSSCLQIWLQHRRTCPFCRAVIMPPPTKDDPQMIKFRLV